MRVSTLGNADNFHVGQVTSEAVEQLHRCVFLGRVMLITTKWVSYEKQEWNVYTGCLQLLEILEIEIAPGNTGNLLEFS